MAVQVKLDPNCGFCFGVKRAVETVYEKLNTGRPIYTYGPIVHNESVVDDLKGRGVKVIEGEDELISLDPAEDAILVIRAHGIPKRVYGIAEKKGLEVLDLTCPFVHKIHTIVSEESAKGKKILIVGNPKHPEVEGIVGWCSGENHVIDDPEAAERFEGDPDAEYTIVSQTTYQTRNFERIVAIFDNRAYNMSVVNTICNATLTRQESARRLASEVDAMVVIGGKSSSNTRKLYEICLEECENTVCIQTPDDLHLVLPESASLVGITAGASTPQKIIEEVQNYVRAYF